MDEKRSQLTEEEMKLIEETERFMEEVYSDPEIANAPIPEDMRENVFRQIHAREEEKARQAILGSPEVRTLTDEDRELIRLGKKYKKQRKARKYLILAAALVLALAFGVTSMGGPEKVFEKVSWMLAGREQMNVDSDDEDVTPTFGMDEEELYQKIEEQFGFQPVRITWFPENVAFLEGNTYVDLPSALVIYGVDGRTKISLNIRANYRSSSWGKDVEDELIQEYELRIQDTVVSLKQYQIEGKDERWLAGFEYKNVNYSLLIMDTNQEEVEEILKSLYFP